MDYVIYTVGNAQFLGAIFNGVAAITTSNSFTTLISIGMLFGVLYCCWECVMNGTRAFNLQHMLVAIAVYLCMFGPTRTVIIQDVYNNNTGDVVVDNIPLGVAASGSIVSRIGYNICVLIETAYHPAETVATVYQGGFAEPLRILNQFRTFDFGPEVMKAINEKLGKYTPYNSSKAVLSDYRQAVSNYVRDCTYPEIQMGHKSIDEIKTAKADASPLKSNSTALHTYLPIARTSGNSDSQTFSCSAGYDVLTSVFNDVFSDTSVTNAMAKGIGGSLLKNAGSLDNIDQSLKSLGLVGTSAQQMTKNRIVNSVLDAAASGHYKTMQDSATAIATMSAIDQRNIQWASEGTMFTQSMHALMTFIEGFVYAIMPIMAFVFVMGAMGMRIVGKYFQIILWIQLWYPIMAIVNLYVMSSTKNALQPYATSNSYYFLDKVFSEVETHIGVAGLMLGATPMLALLIITGSSMAFTAIAGRMGGQDHFNEKNIQPDALNVAPLSQIQSTAYTNLGQGTRISGAEGHIPTIATGEISQKTLSSAEERMRTRTDAATEAFQNSVGKGVSIGTAGQIQREIGATVQGSDVYKTAQKTDLAKEFASKYATNDSINHDMSGNFANLLSGRLTLKGIGGGPAWEWRDSTGQLHSESTEKSHLGKQMAQFSKEHSAALSTAVNEGQKRAFSKTYEGKSMSSLSRNLGQAFSDSASAGEKYSEVASQAKHVGMNTNTALDQHTTQIWNKANTAEVSPLLHNLFRNRIPNDEKLAQFVNHKGGFYNEWKGNRADADEGKLMAAVEYMWTQGSDEDRLFAMKLYNAAEGKAISQDMSASKYENLPDVNTGNLRSRAAGVTTEAGQLKDPTQEAEDGLKNTKNAVDSGTQTVQTLSGKTATGLYNETTPQVKGEYDANANALEEEKVLATEKSLWESTAGSRLSGTQLVGAKVNQAVKDPNEAQKVFDAAKLTNAQQRVAHARANNRQPEQADLDAIRTETAQIYDAHFGKVNPEDKQKVADRAERVKKSSDAIIANILHGSVENSATYARITAFNESMLGEKLGEFQKSELRGSTYTPNSLQAIGKKAVSQDHLDAINRARDSVLNDEARVLGVGPKSLGESEQAKQIPK